MYLSGKLVHADYMFNGYSNTKKDFMKHVSHPVRVAYDNDYPLPGSAFELQWLPSTFELSAGAVISLYLVQYIQLCT